MRTIDEIINDYLVWYAGKTGDKSYLPESYLNVSEEDLALKKGIAFKNVIELCYSEDDGEYWFVKFVLGDMTYAGYPERIIFNKLWLDWMKLSKKARRLAIVCARQHGKSTYWTVVKTLYRCSFFQNYNVLIESATEDQAIEKLDFICKLIDRNEFLAEKKGVGNKWTATEVTYNGGKIVAKGVGSEVRGGTYDYIICDDILRADNKLGDAEIENFIEEELEPMMLVRKGQMVIVGTPKSSTDIFDTIDKKIREGSAWCLYRFPAILDMEKKILLSPERFTFNQLMIIRSTIGHKKFDKEFMCHTYASGSQLFPDFLLKHSIELGKEFIMYKYAKKADENLQYYVGCDCARAGTASGDYTVVIVLAYNPVSQDKRIVWMWRDKGLKISEQVDHIAEIAKNFNYPIVMVEQNNMGQEFIDMLTDNYNVTVEAFTTTRVTKENIIRALINVFEHEKMIIPTGDDYSKEQASIILDELGKFVIETTLAGNEIMKGSGRSHDDICMAMAIANKCTQTGGGQAFAFSGNRRNTTDLERFVKTNDKFEIYKW
jgi:hypothetical protein